MNKILLSVLVFFYTILAAQNSKPYIPQQKNLQAHYPKVPVNNAKSSGCWIPLDGSYTDITNLFTQSYSPIRYC
jgi:hypothetical protein